MTKTAKIDMINEALGKSEVAQRRQARAVLNGQRIEYQMLSRNGRYMQKVSYQEIIGTMWGEDIRRINAATR